MKIKTKTSRRGAVFASEAASAARGESPLSKVSGLGREPWGGQHGLGLRASSAERRQRPVIFAEDRRACPAPSGCGARTARCWGRANPYHPGASSRVGRHTLIMEDSHKSNTSETAPQSGSTVQAAHISHIAQQVSSLSESEESQDSSDSIGSSQKTHGILARRPSYRKILKDLSSEDTRGRKGDGENPGVSAVTSMSVPTPIYQTSTGQYIAIAPNGALQLASPGTDGVQGLQTLTMTNSGSTQQGTTILQYAQTSDGQQILVPSNQVVVQTASGDMQTYQIRTTPSATSLPQTVVMTSPVTLTSQTSKTDDPQLKREIRLMKNREAARECRRKKKEYVKCLENRVAVLENQNKTLIEELKTLKDLYSNKSV